MTDYATLEKIDDVSVISLDDGKVNVFSIEMLEAINNCLNDVPKDSGSLVIKGKEGIFSAYQFEYFSKVNINFLGIFQSAKDICFAHAF